MSEDSDTHRLARFEWRGRWWSVCLRLEDEQLLVIPKPRPDEIADYFPHGGFVRQLDEVRREARDKPRGLCAKVLKVLDILPCPLAS